MAAAHNFPNYLQIPPLLSLRIWHVLRAVSVLAALAMAVLLVTQPRWALPLFWWVIVPVLPAVFMIIPGLWRNLCPLAAMNQTPRLFGFTRRGAGGAASTEARRPRGRDVGARAAPGRCGR